ncbi:MAG: YraN family protein [Chitinophagaceae bacterium]
MAKHNLLGAGGEALAAKWLEDKGFTLLHLNWRHSYYEVDIIASMENVLHFIEVKTRRNKKFGEPEESVDKKKIINLMKAGEEFQYQYPQWKRVQYDVLSISIQSGNAADYFFIEDVYL